MAVGRPGGIYLDFQLNGLEAGEQYWMDDEAISYECMYLNKEDRQ